MVHINGTKKMNVGLNSTCHDGITGISLDLPSLTTIKLEKYAVYKHFKHKGTGRLRKKGKDMPCK